MIQWLRSMEHATPKTEDGELVGRMAEADNPLTITVNQNITLTAKRLY